MKTKLLLAAAAVAAFPTAALAQRAPAASVLVVDTTRVLNSCTACVAATNALQAQENTFQQRRQALLAPLQTEEQTLQQEAQRIAGLSGAARTTAENAMRPRVTAFQQRQQTAAQELRNLQQNFESTRVHVSVQLNQRLQPIYTQVMNSRGANLIMSADARLAHGPALDVTNEVLAALNQQAPTVSITPMPQGQQQSTQPQQPRPGGR